MMKIAVGLSGGVDSSVSLALLKEAGHEVIALFMKNWEEDDHCPATLDYEDALSVCETLHVPLYSFNFAKEYWENVFQDFLRDYEKGFTPNPDIFCNREIKFKVFLSKALELGADYLATGHYAQIGENFTLLRGEDETKDQSYFLYTLKREQLKKVLFPVGHLKKSEVRKIAADFSLPTSHKKDSTGICFIGKRNFADFLHQYMPPKEGVFITPEGKVVGRHQGAYYYTIGQRKGMGIGGAGEAWFVVDKDVEAQTVTVVQGEDHPLLYKESLIATEISWVGDAPSFPYRCTAKIRYRASDEPCMLEWLAPDNLKVHFDRPQRAVTPRQAIVFYQGKTCLGGGLISLPFMLN